MRARRAVILAYEGVFDVCYKVKLDNGLFKEAVPEEEISSQVKRVRVCCTLRSCRVVL